MNHLASLASPTIFAVWGDSFPLENSRPRYSCGVDRHLFENQFTLAQLVRDELLAVVNLYRALGGGWQ